MRIRNGLITLVVAASLAACSDDSSDKKTSAPTTAPPTAPAPPPATTTSPEEKARADALVVYTRGQGLFEQVQRNGRIGDENVTTTLTGRAKGLWTSVGLKYEQQGVRLEGEVTHDPKISAVDLSATPPVATVTDCIDASKAKAIDTKTGETKATSPTPRYPQTVTLVQQDGQWLMSDLVEDRDRSC
ncbi:hypothetical protein [Embleya sp. MST-111070]|uniref:hypothetical protein n=1 Tax=Embleya sp. MST-111070 TaxID=3398231 RepID=UPI003F74195B